MKNSILLGDCLELMKDIPDKSIDMILADLPYNTKAYEWDNGIDISKLFIQYKRIVKDTSNIVLFSSQPYASQLILENIELFKYELIWNKKRHTNPLMSKIRPLAIHENILIFGKSSSIYNKSGWVENPNKKLHGKTYNHKSSYSSVVFTNGILDDYK